MSFGAKSQTKLTYWPPLLQLLLRIFDLAQLHGICFGSNRYWPGSKAAPRLILNYRFEFFNSMARRKKK